MKYLLLFILITSPIFALESIDSKLYYAVCKIRSYDEDNNVYFATGFFIDYPSYKDHLIITCAHAAKNKRYILEIRKENETIYETAEVLLIDDEYDVAILKIKYDKDFNPKYKLKLFNSPERLKVGTLLLGFGTGMKLPSGAHIGFLTDKVCQDIGFEKCWTSSNSNYGGASGGPLLEFKSKKVIGIVSGAAKGIDGGYVPNYTIFCPAIGIYHVLKKLENK